MSVPEKKNTIVEKSPAKNSDRNWKSAASKMNARNFGGIAHTVRFAAKKRTRKKKRQ